MNTPPSHDGQLWLSARAQPRPSRIRPADHTLSAAQALRHCREGVSLLWQGDWTGLRQLLRAMDRRLPWRGGDFGHWRQHQAHRAALLNRVLVSLDISGAKVSGAPDIREACISVYGHIPGPAIVSARELLGVLSAHQWRRTGIPIPALSGARIHPHYGVFPPTRHEYVDLVATTPVPPGALAFELGTGTGVLAAVLARRGFQVVATDLDPRAVACTEDNLNRLGLADRVRVEERDLFPPGRADLVVCNPPWLPGRVRGGLDRGVFDPGGRMLSAFLDRLARHLRPGGEGWLVLSDLAEILGLREPGALTAAIAAGGLRVLGQESVRPRHPRSRAVDDPLHAARAAETITLWRLGIR